MHTFYLKKILLLALVFFWAAPAFSEDKNGSASLDIEAAKKYLSVQGSADFDLDTRLLSSLGLRYENSRNSGVKAMETTLNLDRDGEIFFGGVSLSFGNDDQTRVSLGGKVNVGASWEYAKGFAATLSLSGGPTRFSASQSLSGSAAVLGGLKKKGPSEAITQWNPGVDLNLDFFDQAFSLSGNLCDFRYQNYASGSGLAGTATRDAAASSLRNTLMSGFADWQWSVGASVKLPWKFSLSADYSESLDLDSQAWSKSLSASLSKKFSASFRALLGLTHATEGGSGDNTFKAGATYDF